MTINDPSMGDATTEQQINDEPMGGAHGNEPSETNPDLWAWVQGVRPTRRAAVVYARFDLQARLDELAELIPRLSGDQQSAAETEASELQAEILASGMTFTFEGRSQSWMQQFVEDLKAQGVTESEDILLAQMAAQCVTPEGVTVDLFRQIAEMQPVQFATVVSTLVDANTATPHANPFFLAKSSGAKKTRPSRKR